MIKADLYYKKNISNILENGYLDENPRPKYIDGTPAHSKFITGVFEEYDISKNEFPIHPSTSTIWQFWVVKISIPTYIT